MNRTVSEALDSYVENLAIPAAIEDGISNARSDLYNGPLYLDADGEHCSCFDDGARQFDFSAACDRIRDALDSVSDVWVDTEAGDWTTSEPEPWEDDDGEMVEPLWSDYRHVERSDVIAHIVGKALAEYVK